MKMPTGIVLLVIALLMTGPVMAYEAWQPATGDDSSLLAEYENILDRFTDALERAAAAQAAHPQFMADLEEFRAEFAELLLRWVQAAPPTDEYVSATNIPNLTGTWDIVANTHRNTLVIDHRGSVINGQLFGDEIANGRIEADGTVHFVRSGPNQVYTGTISTMVDGKLRLFGTFDCPVTGGRNLTWEAIRH